MAMTRQYGNSVSPSKGTITFSPANLEINSSLLPDFGDFSLKIIVNIKDSNGYVVPNDTVSLKLGNLPNWIVLSSKDISESTNMHGNTTLTVNGHLEKVLKDVDSLSIPFTIHSEYLQFGVPGALNIFE